MTIEIIPSGASAVVTDRHGHGEREKWVEIMEAIKDAEADNVRTVKDAEADLERSSGQHYADTVKTIKDTEADLERSAGLHYGDTVKTIKDSESNVDGRAADRFMQTVQDIKDAECRLDRSAGDRFMQTIQDIKEAELNAEKGKGHIVDTVRQTAFAAEVSEGNTRETLLKKMNFLTKELCDEFGNVKREVGYGFKDAQATAYRLAAESDKTACQNQMQTLLQFKDQALLSEKLFAAQALLSEKLAAQAAKEAAECCCEIKELVRADGQKTRDLINSQEVDRLRDRANKAESGLAAYFAAKVAPVIPVL